MQFALYQRAIISQKPPLRTRRKQRETYPRDPPFSSSPCSVFAVTTKREGECIGLEIVVRLVIGASEIFIEKFAAINLAPVIIFHRFDQSFCNLLARGGGKEEGWDVSINSQVFLGERWRTGKKIFLVD